MEDEPVDVGRELVAAQVRDAPVLVRLAHGEQLLAAEELDRDPAGGLAALGVEDVGGDAHFRRHRILADVDERERFLIRYAGSFAPEPIARAEGAWVETTGGKRILDFTSGQICSTLGHNHPRIVAAVRSALDDVVHLNSWMLSEPVLALGERLAGLFPQPLDRVLLLNTGTEANEVALKMAKMHTGRWEVVGLTRSFHGLLSGIASVNFSMAHAGYGPVLPGAFAIPAPYAYRCPVRHCDGACDCTCLEVGFELVDQQSVGSLCALVAEPVLSAGGIIVPPDGYFRRVRELLDERGMLLLLDEAQTGFGRLGTMFGFEHDGVVPDLVGVSKTLGGGLPLAATITTSAIEQDCYDKGFLHVTSHVSDPLPAAAGLAVLDVIAEEGLVERAAARGEYMLGRLRELQALARAHRRRPRPRPPRRARAGRGPREQGARRRARRRRDAGVLRARSLHEHRPLAGPRELLPHRAAADRVRGRDRSRRRDHGRLAPRRAGAGGGLSRPNGPPLPLRLEVPEGLGATTRGPCGWLPSDRRRWPRWRASGAPGEAPAQTGEEGSPEAGGRG